MTGRQARRVRQDRLVHRATTARKGRPVPPEPIVRQAPKACKVHPDRRVIPVARRVRPVLRGTMACKAPPVPQVRMARKARPVK